MRISVNFGMQSVAKPTGYFGVIQTSLSFILTIAELAADIIIYFSVLLFAAWRRVDVVK